MLAFDGDRAVRRVRPARRAHDPVRSAKLCAHAGRSSFRCVERIPYAGWRRLGSSPNCLIARSAGRDRRAEVIGATRQESDVLSAMVDQAPDQIRFDEGLQSDEVR